MDIKDFWSFLAPPDYIGGLAFHRNAKVFERLFIFGT